MTIEESRKILDFHAKGDQDILGIKNHKKYLKPLSSNQADDKNIFYFTIRIMSHRFMMDLLGDSKVKNVYYNPSYTPPDGSLDSISLRYKVYVQYYN